MSLLDIKMRWYVARREKFANYDLSFEGVTVERNIRYGERKGQVFSLYRKSKKRLPVFVYFHGGALAGRTKSARRALCAEIAKLGVAVLNVEYKGEVALGAKECLAESEKILAYLKENYSALAVDIDRLILGGDELGAYVASYLATKAENYGIRPVGVALHSGYYDAIRHAKENSYFDSQYKFIKKFYKIDLKQASFDSSVSTYLKSMSVTSMVTEDFPSTFICHSVNDEFLPEQSSAMVKALTQKDVYIWEFKAIDRVVYHNFHLDRKSGESQVVMEYLSAFIKEAVDGGVYSNEYREI
ncbi:MAG: alpha/beta hydrolase [Clostridia bacterium]|nr:alpha/beta hydrolase [Clostridia bacterium]